MGFWLSRSITGIVLGESPARALMQETLNTKGGNVLITCFIRYLIDPDKLQEFEQYGRVWMRLIEKYGGTHHGYFVPDESAPAVPFSFSDIGQEGQPDFAVALFSFPNLDAYEKYRREVPDDPDCQAETRHFHETKCFTKYERTFMRSVARE
jgi:hypothetical protein